MKKNFKKLIAANLAVMLLCTVSFGSTAVYADSTSSDDSASYTYMVDNAEDLEAAVQNAGASIYVYNNTYTLDEGLYIASGVSISGQSESGVIFDFGSSLMSSQSALYITNSEITLKNITFENNSSAAKPVLKIQADSVSLINCMIVNASTAASALVLHDSKSIVIDSCDISNTDSSDSYYSVIQINSGSAAQVIDSTTITSGSTLQAHISFEYSDNGNYDAASTLTFDTSVIFDGGYNGKAVIYSAAPNGTVSTAVRTDIVYLITSDGTVKLSRQTEDTKDGLQTGSTGWYCYNAEAWNTWLLNAVGYYSYGYVYTNTSSGGTIVRNILFPYLS